MVNKKHLSIYLLLFTLVFAACDDNGAGENPDEASLSVEQQGTVDGNQVVIDEAIVSEGSWVVIHRSNAAGDGPMVPEIIGKAQLTAGTNTDVQIQLQESVSDGEQLWAMLHNDTGTEGEYEFGGQGTPDQPITVDGEIVTQPFTITQTDPSISAQNQPNDDNEYAVTVNAAEDGWVVIHRSNAAGDGPMVPEIIGKTQVDADVSGEVTVTLNDGETVADGEQLWPMLHYDTGTEGEYEFTGEDSADQPVIVDGDIVVTSFTAQ